MLFSYIISMYDLWELLTTQNSNREIKGLMKEALNECDLKANKQKQVIKDLKNLKIEDSSSGSNSSSDSSDESDQETKPKVLKKRKKVSVFFFLLQLFIIRFC